MTTDHLHALPSGTRLQEFRLDAVLGAGGFGITYRAHDELLDKVVAIKEYLPRDFATRSAGNTVAPIADADARDYQWGLSRFLDEARTLARFDHPHINKVYRFFETNGTAYMALEYIHGETLANRLGRERRLSETDLLRLLEEVLSGLAEIHNAGYVHRDIKPGNLMLRAEDGSAVLLDFGAARQAVGQRSKSITSILTPGYAPIEQYDSKADDVGPWSDIYSLGMVAYKCVSGAGDGELPDAVTRGRSQRKGGADLVSAVEAGKGRYSAKLLEAIDWAIEVDEDARPQGVGEWLETLAGSRGRKRVTKPARKAATRSAKAQAAKRTGMSWPDVALVTAIVVLLGASAWQGWRLYQGRPEVSVDGAETVVEPQAGMQAEPELAAEFDTQTPVTPIEKEDARAKELTGEMVAIPGGTFLMGDLIGVGDDDEKPVRTVTVPAFQLGKYEVTVGQFGRFVEETGYSTDVERSDQGCIGVTFSDEQREFERTQVTSWSDPGFLVGYNHPVVCVSWNDAQEFVKWLNRRAGGKFRLPSEAEWEYAVRARSRTRYHFGSNKAQLCQYENHATISEYRYGNKSCSDGVRKRTAIVGRYKPNSFGLYDMHGNVSEWVEDCWNDSYAGAPSDGSAWTSGDCAGRMIRGGAWMSPPWGVRSAIRVRESRSTGFNVIGFRLARDN